MSQRSKNLLEAFNQSKAPEKSAEPVAQPRGSAPRVGGPFADAPVAARPKPPANLYESRPVSAETARSPRERLRVVVLCAAVALIFFFIGRASVPGVQAAGSSEVPAPAGALPAAPLAQRPISVQGNDQALSDPANQATILAITYNKVSPENEQLATATAAHLITQGLPASVYRNPTKKQIYVLVGAAPKTSDLDALLVRVQSATSARGQQEFTTAWSVPIDHYLVRKTH